MVAPNTIVVLNPVSGGGDVTEAVRRRADDAGFAVRETEGTGDGARLAREAAEDGAERVVAAGGDGTVNEVVQGLSDAGALGDVTLGVVPAGTGNNYAGNLGIEGVAHAFDLLADGEVRELDLGVADDRVFANSCVGGFTAEASDRTTPELKERLGVLAYVVATLQTAAEFEPLPLAVEASDPDAGTEVWRGEAAIVAVGNARHFGLTRVAQADVEDGLLEVAIVTEPAPGDLATAADIEALLDRDAEGSLFDPDAEWIHRRRTDGLDVTVQGDPVGFSFDGETETREELSLGVRPAALSVHVGEDYEPRPGDRGPGD